MSGVGYVQKRAAKTCRDRLVQAEVKLLGVVLNRHQGIEGRYRSGYSGTYGAYGAAENAYGVAEAPEPDPLDVRTRRGKKGDVAAL